MNKKIVIWILFIGLFIRSVKIGQMLSEFSTRQVETAMIARNFYQHGYNIFYPKIDIVGEGGREEVFVLELGIMPFITALLYKISGGVHESLGRIVSIAFWLGSAIVFYRWTLLFGERLAILSLLVYTFLPLSIIMGRTFQPEMAMIFFSISGLYYLTRYSLGKGESNLWMGSISISMAILLKITAFALLCPFIFLFFKKEGYSKIRFCIAILFISSLPIAWYSRGYLLSQIYPSELSTGNWSLSNWFDFYAWFRPENWRDIFSNLWGIVLTPLGFSLFLLGFFLKKDRPVENLFYWWLFGIVFALLLFFYHARTHVYYWLPMVPVGSYFISSAIVNLKTASIGDKIYNNIFIRKIFIPLVVGIMLFYFVYPAYRVPRTYRYVKNVVDAVESLITPDSLIIASCSSGPYLLYYCNRRGWDFWAGVPGKEAIRRLEYLREHGAEYFVSANLEELNNNKVLSEYLYSNYKIVWKREREGVIFLLQ